MKADHLLRAFSMIGEDPARIQQLRQVAVALAIAGKLGAGPTAITTDEMLRAVEKIKKDLCNRRVIPKPKDLKFIEQDELPESFRNLGRFTALGSLARVEKGLTGIKQAIPGPFPAGGDWRRPCEL
jgi:type I restriction enzyme, S subunit